MDKIFYNTNILKGGDDIIIAGATADFFKFMDDEKGITAESVISCAETNISLAVEKFYDDAYTKSLEENPDKGNDSAVADAMQQLNNLVKEYLPEYIGLEFLDNLKDLTFAIYNSSGFAYWKIKLRQRFEPFTNTTVPKKVLLTDLSGGEINISEECAEKEVDETTLPDILNSLSNLMNE